MLVLPHRFLWGCPWWCQLLTLLGQEPSSLGLTLPSLDHFLLQWKGHQSVLLNQSQSSPLPNSYFYIIYSTVVYLDYHSSLYLASLTSFLVLSDSNFSKARVIFPRHESVITLLPCLKYISGVPLCFRKCPKPSMCSQAPPEPSPAHTSPSSRVIRWFSFSFFQMLPVLSSGQTLVMLFPPPALLSSTTSYSSFDRLLRENFPGPCWHPFVVLITLIIVCLISAIRARVWVT